MVMTLMMKSIFEPPYWQLGYHIHFNIPRAEKYSKAMCYLIGSRPVRREARDGEHIAALVMVKVMFMVKLIDSNDSESYRPGISGKSVKIAKTKTVTKKQHRNIASRCLVICVKNGVNLKCSYHVFLTK